MDGHEEVVESMEQEIPSFWTLYIKQLSGSRLRIEDVDPSGNVLDFKIKVSEMISLNVNRQRMIFRGKVLENAKTLGEYGITDNCCIHLLKKAANQTLTSTPRNGNGRRQLPLHRQPSIPSIYEPEEQNQNDNWTFDAGDLSRIINQQLRRTTGGSSRRLGRSFAIGDNVEHIYQGIATLETLESHFQQRRERLRNSRAIEEKKSITPDTHNDIIHCLDDEVFGSMPDDGNISLVQFLDDDYVEEKVNSIAGFNVYFDHTENMTNLTTDREEIRHFKVGQWIDCLDTVNQWLEATVTHVSEDKRKIRVHFNGWGTRWDETIEVTSPRLARFRTKSKRKTPCKSFSPTLSHWVNHTPKINSSNDIQQLTQAVTQASAPILAQLKRVTEDEYGNCATFEEAQDEKRQDVIELAPKLDILGRAIADLGRTFANRPNYKRRQDYLRQPNSLLQLVRIPLLPFNLKTSIERDRKVNGEWNNREREELVRNLEYDEQLVHMTSGPNNVQARVRNTRNVELHLHTIVSSAEFRLPNNNNETVTEENEQVGEAGEAMQTMLDSITEEQNEDGDQGQGEGQDSSFE